MEDLKSVKKTLMGQVQAQMGDLSKVNTHELGEVIDMVKDLEEAIYYCSIVKAMEDKEKQPEVMYYREYPIYRDMDRYDGGRMYYDDGYMRYAGGSNGGGNRGSSSGNGGSNSNSGNSSRNYEESSRGDASSRDRRGYDDMMVPYNNPYLMDYRQGRSPMARKAYMESKEMHQDKTSQMHELEKYLKELSNDITEMIDDASPEERAILRDKMTTLASKIK